MVRDAVEGVGVLCLPGAYKLLDGGNVPAWNSKNQGIAEPLARIATGVSSVTAGEVGLAEAGGCAQAGLPPMSLRFQAPGPCSPRPFSAGSY